MKRISIAALTALIAVATAIGIGAGTASAQDCGYENGWYVAVTSLVSCGLGINVARGVDPSSVGGQFNLTAYSAATGTTYPITCTDTRRESPYAVAYTCAVRSSVGGAVLIGH